MKPYFAYIRVSTAKQGQLGSSLQEQRDAILAFAKRNNLTIDGWYEDRETAAKKGRTQFVRMMASLEKRQAAGVILHKIDRGARNLWDWARIQDLIDRGIEVHFAHDNLDMRSRGGRLAADIQAVVAADYVRNLREEVRKGMWGRLKQGLYPWKAPVGYLDQGKAKPKIIDPIKGLAVKAAFHLYASKRFSYRSLAAELHRRGLCRRNGKPLALNSITELLHNPFYIGIIRLKKTGETFAGVHEPLVDTRTFQAVQDIISRKSNTKCRKFDFIFRRLLNCGHCGSALTGELQKGMVYYRCHTRGCATTSVREDRIAAEISFLAKSIEFGDVDPEELKPYIAHWTAAAAENQRKVVAALKLRIANISAREQRLTDAYLDQALDRETYEQRRTSLRMELAEARDDRERAETQASFDQLDRSQAFFELVRMLQLSARMGSRAKYRDAVENLTSNRQLNGKKLSFTLRSPFRELAADEAVQCSPPSRDTIRTERRSTPRSAKKRAEGFVVLLQQWTPPASFIDTNRVQPMRKPLPQWFKPKQAPDLPLDDQLPCAT